MARVTDRLYFRQLLSGRDFAVGDPVATQMVNFVYAVGDRPDRRVPARRPGLRRRRHRRHGRGRRHGRRRGARHALPPRSRRRVDDGSDDRGRSARLLERVDVPGPRATRRGAVGRQDAPASPRPSSSPTSRAITSPSARCRSSWCTRRATRRGASASSSTDADLRRHAVPRGVRAHRPARQRHRADVRQPAAPRRPAGRHGRLPRPPLLGAAERVDGRGPRAELRVPAVVARAVADDVRRGQPAAAATSAETPATVSSVSTRRRKRRGVEVAAQRDARARAPTARAGRATATAIEDVADRTCPSPRTRPR